MNINKETMKKVLVLTKCNSTEEICDVLEKEIDNKQKANKAVKEASESLIEEYKKEAVAVKPATRAAVIAEVPPIKAVTEATP